MKLKNTILLVVLAGALFTFIGFYEKGQLSSREAEEQAGRVVTFERDKMDAITIKNSESKIELRKDDQGVWRLQEPVKDRADSLAVAQLFTTAESLRHDAVIGDRKKGAEKDQLKEYGLLNAETKVKFSGKEKTVELLFGKDAAVEGKVYVQLGGSNAAYVIGKDLKEQISKKVDEFRDHKLTDLNTVQVTKVTLKTAAGEIELAKKDQHWSLVKPLKARGDDAAIGDLISKAATAQIERFVDAAANLSNHGLETPRGTISLYVEGSAQPTVLQLGAKPQDEKDKEKTYAKVSTREGVVLLPQSVNGLIETKPNDLRDRRLARIEADIVDRIQIEGAGKEKVTLARKGESWVRKVGDQELPVNVAAARRVLDEVREQQVAAFVADVATELPKYGLDQPRLKLTFSSFASENTAETKAGEKPIAAIHFGKAENGNVFALLEGEPFIVSAPETLLGWIMTDPLEWQPLEIFHAKGEEISAVEVTREGQPVIALERDKEKKWKLAKGDGAVNQINAQSMVNTLASLRAVRWMGAAQPEFGLDQPILTVIFKTASGPAGTLTVGKNSPEETAYAAAGGMQGAFSLSKPDFSAFQLPLLEKPAPAEGTLPITPPPVTDPAASSPPEP